MKDKIRVAIFDDNQRVRDAASMLIDSSEDMICVGAFNSCRNLTVDIQSCNPEVIIMDIDMPGINGIEAVKCIRIAFPEIAIMMQTVFENDEHIFSAIRAGAGGYMLKNSLPLDILEAIRQVHAGGAPMSPLIARKVLNFLGSVAPDSLRNADEYKLSKREKEVLEQLVIGKSYKMIADTMDISYETVRQHMKHIYEKLHVSSMTEAVIKAIREKLV